MNWLSGRWGFIRAVGRRGIRLGDDPAWEISAPNHAARFFRALTKLTSSADVLYLEGGSPSVKLRSFPSARISAASTRVEMGTIWPRPGVLHLAITPQNLDGLADLADRHAIPEIAVHLHVYRDNVVLLQWHDAGSRDPLLVSKRVTVEQVKAFCDRLGIDHRDSDRRH